jgi:hypothetical protein
MPESENTPTIFVRFRSGNRLDVEPDIAQKIRDIRNQLLANRDHRVVFRDKIIRSHDITPNTIQPECTWYAAVKEIFDAFENREPISDELRLLLLNLLELLGKRRDIKNRWPQIRSFLLENIDRLTSWDENRSLENLMHREVQRDRNGKYYTLENGQRIEIIGLKTLPEEKYERIADAATNPYRPLGKILRLISLIDIAAHYLNNPSVFSNSVVCSLPENDYDTAFSHWRWYGLNGADWVPVPWQLPNSAVSNPEWLATDLLLKYSESAGLLPNYEPQQIVSDDSLAKYQATFLRFTRSYEVSLDTDLYIGPDKDYYFDFEDRTVRWVNGTNFMRPVLTVPCDEEYPEGQAIAKRFLSVLVKETGMPIVELFSVGVPRRYDPTIVSPRTNGGLQLEGQGLITDDTATYSPTRWTALGLYQEGVNAKSPYYAFLSFYKIIELAFNRNANQIKTFINTNIAPLTSRMGSNWMQETLANGKTAYNHLYGSRRCAVAHISATGQPIIDPNNSDDYLMFDKDLPIIRGLVDELFRQALV